MLKKRSPNSYRNLDSNGVMGSDSTTNLDDIEDQGSQSTYSLDEALDYIGVGKSQFKLIAICGCWWAADAIEVMLLSFLLPTLEKEWKLKGWQSALIASATFLGVLVGSFAWGMVADKLGRRKGYLATALFTSIFGVASCFANGYVSMMILRGLLGFGIGGSPVAFSMLSEFLPRNDRGAYLIFFEAFWTLGTVLETLLAWVVLPTLGWRWLLALSSIPLWGLLVAYPFLPESPRFLLISGEYDKAVKVLSDTAALNKSQLPPEGRLDRDFKDESRGNFLDLLSPSVRRLSILLWVLWIAHAVIYYGNVLFTPKFYGSHHSPTETTPASPAAAPGTDMASFAGSLSDRILDAVLPIFRQRDDGPTSPISSTPQKKSWLNLYVFVLLTTLSELPGLIGAAYLVERLGRRKTMAVSLGVCVGALFGLIFGPPGWLGVALLSISRMGINGSMATLWAFTPESYPTTLRATGLGVANAFAKLATTGTPFISTALPDKYLWVAILVFALCCLGGIVAALCLPFDTKDTALSSSLSSFRSSPKSPTDEVKEDSLELSSFSEHGLEPELEDDI